MNKIRVLSMLVFCLFIGYTSIATEQLVFAVTVIRHGDRTPTHEIKSDPHTWEIGIGELTALGMNQHNQLGQSLRKRYIDDFKLLTPQYQNNSIYVRSTDFNRTIQSAESLLSGLYPLGLGPIMADGNPALPAAYQPIPLRTLPVSQDKLLLAHDAYINLFKNMCDKYVYTSKSWRDMENKYKGKFNEWSMVYGVPIEKLSDLSALGDNLNVRERNGIEIPKGLSKKDVKDIIWLGDWIQAQQFKPAEVGDYFGSDFLVQLKKDMKSVQSGKQQYKYILYSGHDSTLLPILSALRIPLKMNPPYASHIEFEMYKENNDYYIEVRFNDMAIKLPGQKSDKCTIKDFYKIVDKSVAGEKKIKNSPICHISVSDPGHSR